MRLEKKARRKVHYEMWKKRKTKEKNEKEEKRERKEGEMKGKRLTRIMD